MAENQLPNNDSTEILFENLHPHKNAWKLAKRIFRMLTSVGVIDSDIISIVVENYRGRAIVYFKDKIAQEFTIKVFSDVRDVMNFYDIRKVTAHPMGLRLSKRKCGSHSSSDVLGRVSLPSHDNEIVTVNRSPLPSTAKTKRHPFNISPILEEQPNDIISSSSFPGHQSQVRNPAAEETSSSTTSSLTMQNEFERLEEEGESSSSTNNIKKSSMLDASTSVSGLPPGKKTSNEGESGGTSSENDDPKGRAIMVDVKTSTPQVSPCFCPETIFYHKNQLVGTETRHAEFKQGGVVFELRSFRSLLGRYLCAFMNTEGGVIYFGVTDDGKVIGIKVDQKFEDQLRLSIDNSVSAIRPPVPTSAYSINFAKIMGTDGQILQDLKVLEVCVHPRYSTKTPYSFDNNVYVRRDGSIRTM